MKFTTEELLFATAVRKILVTKITAQLPENFTPEDRAAAFKDAAKVRSLIADTVKELEGIAAVIAETRAT